MTEALDLFNAYIRHGNWVGWGQLKHSWGGAWDLSSKRGGPCRRDDSTWKDGAVFSMETFLLGSLICMSLHHTHHPPRKPTFVYFDNVSHCVFVCTVFHFYKPLYWCLDEQYMLHTSTLISLYMKLYSYKNADLQKGLLRLMLALNHFNVLERERF